MGNAAWVDEDLAAARHRRRDQTIHEELTAGEKVVWEGQPQLGWLFLLALPAAFVGVVTLIVSWVWAVGTRNSDLAFALSLPFLLGSVALLLAPVWFVWRGMGTIYAITNRRVIIAEPLLIPGLSVRSFPPAALTRMVRNQRSDGSGDLIFEEVRRIRLRDRRFVRRGFIAVTDVRRVETILRESLLNNRTT